MCWAGSTTSTLHSDTAHHISYKQVPMSAALTEAVAGPAWVRPLAAENPQGAHRRPVAALGTLPAGRPWPGALLAFPSAACLCRKSRCVISLAATVLHVGAALASGLPGKGGADAALQVLRPPRAAAAWSSHAVKHASSLHAARALPPPMPSSTSQHSSAHTSPTPQAASLQSNSVHLSFIRVFLAP